MCLLLYVCDWTNPFCIMCTDVETHHRSRKLSFTARICEQNSLQGGFIKTSAKLMLHARADKRSLIFISATLNLQFKCLHHTLTKITRKCCANVPCSHSYQQSPASDGGFNSFSHLISYFPKGRNKLRYCKVFRGIPIFWKDMVDWVDPPITISPMINLWQIFG